MSVSLPPLLVVALYVVFDVYTVSHLFYAYIAIVLGSVVFVYPFLSNIAQLTEYVNDLAQDKKVEKPELKMLNTLGDVSPSLERLSRSWDRKKQQMENVIIEREILVDSIPDILIMLDSENHIVRTNRAARTIFGQNLAKKHLKEVIHNEMLLHTVYAVVEDMKGREIEFDIAEPSPRDFRAIVERFPVPSAGGISTIITLTDITEMKRAEQMRADFVANASHEIRTPLASIVGFIETLQGPAKDDEEAKEQFLNLMNEQAQRMAQLVQDLLTLSKVEVDASKPPMDKVNLVKV
ncbi:MAG: histidine kinase dimerization/phospho-acceptor domain-containing protein, partial [Rickettsiales bacterium]